MAVTEATATGYRPKLRPLPAPDRHLTGQGTEQFRAQLGHPLLIKPRADRGIDAAEEPPRAVGARRLLVAMSHRPPGGSTIAQLLGHRTDWRRDGPCGRPPTRRSAREPGTGRNGVRSGVLVVLIEVRTSVQPDSPAPSTTVTRPLLARPPATAGLWSGHRVAATAHRAAGTELNLHRLVLDQLSEAEFIDDPALRRQRLGPGEQAGASRRPEPTAGSRPGHVAVAGKHPRHRAVRAPTRDQPRRTPPPTPTRPHHGATPPSCTPTGADATTSLPALPTPARDQGPHRRRGTESSSHLGRVRWIVERIFFFFFFKKKKKKKKKRTQLTLRPLLTFACALINLRRLVQQES